MIENAFNRISELISWLNARTEEYNTGHPTVSDEEWDNKYFELLSPNTDLDNWSKECHFGIVDTDKEARFVFGGSPDIEESPDSFKVLQVPAYLFLQEKIGVKTFVDSDMVLRVEAASSMRPKDYKRVWEYTKLKCYYKLPKKWS